MSRLQRYLPFVFLVPILLLCGKLILTPVPEPFLDSKRGPNADRGWPWVFQTIHLRYDPRLKSIAQANLLSGITEHQVLVGRLAADVAIGLLVVLGAGMVILWRIRKGANLLRFSLKGLLVLTALCAVALACWARVRAGWRHEQTLIDRWGDSEVRSSPLWEYCGPQWLRRLVPWTGQDIFERITRFEIDCDTHPELARDSDLPAIVGQFECVTWLEIKGRSPVHLKDPAGLSRIETLNVANSAADDETLEWVCKLPRLTLFNLFDVGGTPSTISDRGLASLAKCSTLELLYLSAPVQISAAGSEALVAPPNLRALELHRIEVTEGMLTAVARLKSLELLEFAECSIESTQSLGKLAALRKLDALFVEHTNIDDAGLDALATLPALETLGLSGCTGFTENGLRRLLESGTLAKLYLDHLSRFSPDMIQVLRQRFRGQGMLR